MWGMGCDSVCGGWGVIVYVWGWVGCDSVCVCVGGGGGWDVIVYVWDGV